MADREEVSDGQLQAEVAARKSAVAALLQRKDKAGALAASLVDPPFQAKNNDIKVCYKFRPPTSHSLFLTVYNEFRRLTQKSWTLSSPKFPIAKSLPWSKI